LEAGEHLKEFALRRRAFVPVGPFLRRNNWERVVFPDILDMNLEVGRMSVDRLRVSNRDRLAFRSSRGGDLGCALPWWSHFV